MREILTQWQVAGTDGGTSVMYFDEETASSSSQVASIGALWAAFQSSLDNLTTATVQGSGRLIDPATGQLTGFFNGNDLSIPGQAAGNPVANSTQALIRWRTSRIIRGRLVQGRTYVPGMSNLTLSDDGEVFEATRAALASAADGLATNGAGLVIWSRPLKEPFGNIIVPGSQHPVVSGNVWSEFAVQRRRRR